MKSNFYNNNNNERIIIPNEIIKYKISDKILQQIITIQKNSILD